MQVDRFVVLGVPGDYCFSSINLRRISTWCCRELAWNPGDRTLSRTSGSCGPPRLPRAQEFVRLRRLDTGCVELFTRPFLEKRLIISFKFRFAEGELARYVLKGLPVTNSRAYVTGESFSTDCALFQCLGPREARNLAKRALNQFRAI